MKVKLTKHTVEKKTDFGPITKSLNQHLVHVENVNGVFQHVGYVGVNAFLPLAGFPKELCGEVTSECERQLGRKLQSVAPPPSMAQLAQQMQKDTEDE